MKIPLIDKGTAAVAGGVWVALKVGFEIILGRYVMGLSWIRVLEDYNIRDGGLMCPWAFGPVRRSVHCTLVQKA